MTLTISHKVYYPVDTVNRYSISYVVQNSAVIYRFYCDAKYLYVLIVFRS